MKMITLLKRQLTKLKIILKSPIRKLLTKNLFKKMVLILTFNLAYPVRLMVETVI